MELLIKGYWTKKVTFKVDHLRSYYWQIALQAKVFFFKGKLYLKNNKNHKINWCILVLESYIKSRFWIELNDKL